MLEDVLELSSVESLTERQPDESWKAFVNRRYWYWAGLGVSAFSVDLEVAEEHPPLPSCMATNVARAFEEQRKLAWTMNPASALDSSMHYTESLCAFMAVELHVLRQLVPDLPATFKHDRMHGSGFALADGSVLWMHWIDSEWLEPEVINTFSHAYN